MELGHEYFIRICQTGGDERHYYKWYYGNGDTYPDGNAFMRGNPGENWTGMGNDFAFQTYGEYTGDEPDGTVSRWAVVVGTRSDPDDADIYFDEDARDVANILSSNGWTIVNPEQPGQPLIDVFDGQIVNAINAMKADEDADDIVLFYISAHGATLDHDLDGMPDESVVFSMYSEINAISFNIIFDGFASQKIILIFDACGSGGFISLKYNMTQEGRIIMASSAWNEASWASDRLRNGYFTYYLVQGLGLSGLDDDQQGEPGYREISAQEVFPYVYAKIQYKEHPQFWSGIDGEVGITFYQ